MSVLSKIAALMAVASRPVQFLTGDNNYWAWRGGEGYGRAKPRAAKHLRKGAYTQSEARKARRRRQMERAS